MINDKKTFILDTNVLIHDPESIFNFENNEVIIPILVLEELDKFKSEGSERGRNARQVIRHLDSFRTKGSLADGVELDNGGKLRIAFTESEQKCPAGFDAEIIDNQILQTALCLKDRGNQVVFITKDLNARVKADILGIEAIDYLIDSVQEEKVYTGRTTIKVPMVQLKKNIPDDLIELASTHEFTINEFILVESNHNPHHYAVFRYLGEGSFKRVTAPSLDWPLEARNPQQLMALDLLFDNSIQLVSLIGPAGTGKTFLALLAGLQKTLIEEEYEKMLITRPVVPLGPDIGFLPGDIQEKLHTWMQPIYDNMEVIIHSVNAHRQGGVYREEESRSYRGRKGRKTKDRRMPSLEDLVRQNKISLEAITYMRGRSIPYQFIIIDEVQNLTVHEIKTIISRAGEGSKIILLGDPYQIDSPYLDFSSNGLSVATSRFKGQEVFGTVFLNITERSELSRLAGELL